MSRPCVHEVRFPVSGPQRRISEFARCPIAPFLLGWPYCSERLPLRRWHSWALLRMSAASLKESHDQSDEYARTSHLATLKDGDPDEVRFWVSWATFGQTTNGIASVGYIIKGKHSRMCRIAYAGASTVPKKGVCRRYTPHQRSERVVAKIMPLSSFADVAINCGVVDGAWVLIDAVSNGKRFIVEADNPQSCDGDAAKLVSELLTDVGPSS